MLSAQQAWTKPLSSQECAILVSEHSDLTKKDLEATMEQDPAIAAPLLKPEQLAEIERYLFIEGEIRFRCPEIQLAKPKSLEPEPSKTADIKKAEPEKPSGPPVPLPRRKPSPPAKRAG